MATPWPGRRSGAGLEGRAALLCVRPPPAADAGCLTGAALPPSPPGHCSVETEEEKGKAAAARPLGGAKVKNGQT